MTTLVYFIEQIDRGIYLICAAGLLLAIRRFIGAQREIGSARFEVERDIALAKRATAINRLVGLIEVGLAVFAISNVVAPTLRRGAMISPIAQSGPDQRFVTSLPPATAAAMQPGGGTPQGQPTDPMEGEMSEEDSIFITPTQSPTPVGTVMPDVPPPVGCDNPDGTLKVPLNGQVITEAVEVLGTADTDDFAFYKFEIEDNTWKTIKDFTVPVRDGVLGQFVPTANLLGEHRFRMVVFNSTGNPVASCTITIIIQEPQPTATAIPE